MKSKNFSTKRQVRESMAALEVAEKALDVVSDHYDFEYGQNGNCDLDVTLTSVLRKIQEARRELDDLLIANRGGQSMPLSKRRVGKGAIVKEVLAGKGITVRDLQAALVC